VGVPRTIFHADDYYFKALETDDRGRYLFASVHSSPAGNSALLRISLETGRVDRWLGAVEVKVDASGRWMASNGDPGRVRVWDSESGRMTEIARKTSELRALPGRPTPHHLGRQSLRLEGGKLESRAAGRGTWRKITLCPDRERILVQTPDGHLILRRIDGAERRQLTAVINPVDVYHTAVDRACSIVVVARPTGMSRSSVPQAIRCRDSQFTTASSGTSPLIHTDAGSPRRERRN